MELLRIGEKLINPGRIHRTIDKILELRSRGHSQQEVADTVKVDRTFVSRLESLGEIRKGGRVALIAFPIANKEELENVAREEGVDYVLILTDRERWDFVEKRSGVELFNQIMFLVSQVRDYDAVIMVGSDMRIRLAEAVLGPDVVIGMELGPSPIKGDKYVEPDEMRQLIQSVKGRVR